MKVMKIIDKIKENKELIVAVLLLSLILLNVRQCEKRGNEKELTSQLDRSIIAALSDSIREITDKNGKKTYQELVASMNLDDFTSSDLFKTLSKDKQQYYLELKNTKGLMASLQAEVRSQQHTIDSLKYGVGVVVTDSSVCFHKGDSLEYNDTTKKTGLALSAKVYFKNKPVWDIKSSYSTDIRIDYVKQKDKSILLNYKFTDPNLKLIGSNSYIIPVEKRTWQDKLRDGVVKVGIGLGGVGIGYGVGYVQGKLSK